ncbi:ABC transporter ATP-binding protein [Pseudomonas sp. LPB0260]|uniref:ABC transporter ATP-binding protein n=1 Tax=Pseudomonas sp. LPB0260 TaxID=2614442 RepID=UPI0015C2206F|nr:ABC transporter ATP-binding protein [Pseudomonas sp. LPB0260]QLC73630.1 ABC transporter ATP-binding protein [Pseudomonas sp. LPB0260]QLC76404.1 ABC transporter ATP-binding protein [Pseudomonas sp. LPB0260]
MSDFAISLTGVSKTFRRFQHPVWRALDALGWPVSKCRYDIFQALTDINLNISRGEKVALIGRNGAGKSTLLRLISGLMRADCGQIRVNGQVQALMTLGTGFHPDFSGIDNIRSALAYQGVPPSRVEDCIEEIAEFTELDTFLQRPVKEYSAGMYARLAFAVATSTSPEVLIIDEILGAGDAYFLGKCIHRMKTLTNQGATILFVSHDISSVQVLCDRGIWLEGGHIRQDGPLLPVSKAYLASIRDEEERRVRAKSMSLTRGQVSALTTTGGQTSLLRLVGLDGTPPRQPLLLRAVEYGDVSGQLGSIDMAGVHTGGSCLIVDPQFMNWQRVASSADSGCWAFGDFGGRYQHSPLQLAWPNGIPVGAWVQLQLRQSSSHPVLLEQYDPEQGVYCKLIEIAAGSGEVWTTVRVPLHTEFALGRNRRDELLADLQELSSDDRYGSGEVRITGFGFFDAEGVRRHTLITGEPAFAVIAFDASEAVLDPVPVVAIYRPDGTCAMQVIASLSGQRFSQLDGSGGIRVDFSPLLLGPGDYLVSVALFRELNLASAVEPSSYDLHDRCHALKVLPPSGVHVQIGLVNQPAQWELLK